MVLENKKKYKCDFCDCPAFQHTEVRKQIGLFIKSVQYFSQDFWSKGKGSSDKSYSQCLYKLYTIFDPNEWCLKNGLHSGDLNPGPLGLESSALTTRPGATRLFETFKLSQSILSIQRVTSCVLSFLLWKIYPIETFNHFYPDKLI